MSGVIKTQQKAHWQTVCAIHRSWKGDRPKGATDGGDGSFITRSAWMKTVKVLEHVEQLQAEGKRLAQQVSPYDPSRCPLLQLHFDIVHMEVNNVAHSITDGTTSRDQSRRSR